MQIVIEAAREMLEHEYAVAASLLRAIPGVGTGACGLTPDSVKASPAYRVARARYQQAFAALRQFNKRHRPPATRRRVA